LKKAKAILEGGIYTNVHICIKKCLQDFIAEHLTTQQCRNFVYSKGVKNKYM